MTTVSFHCNACGRCCNTPPTMTVAELFHHEDRFVGCLAVRRLARHRPQDVLDWGDGAHRLSVDDVGGIDALAERLLFTPGPRYSLGTQAIDYASLGACSERLADGRCGIQDDGKPATCGTVPLDPLLPDRLQHVVLMSRRRDAAFLGADCIAAGRRDDHAVLVADGRVVDPGYRAAMAEQRDALAAEKSAWGDAVFALLRHDLFEVPAEARRIPTDGFLSLSLVPVLMVLAARSPESRARCLRYARHQVALIERRIGDAVRRRRDADRPLTRELRGFVLAYRRFADASGQATHADLAA